MLKSIHESKRCTVLVNEVALMQQIGILPEDIILEHIANEQRQTANKHLDFGWHMQLKKMGKIKGSADYVVWYGGGMHTRLEMKRDYKAKQTEEQKAFEALCTKMGTPYLCTYSLIDAINFICYHYPGGQTAIKLDMLKIQLEYLKPLDALASKQPRKPRVKKSSE